MNYEFVAIPEEEVPQAADPLFQHLGTIAAQGPHGRRCQGKNDFYSLIETGERLSEIVKGLVR